MVTISRNFIKGLDPKFSQPNQGPMLKMKIFYTSEDFFVSGRHGLKGRDTFTRRNPFKKFEKFVETKQMELEETRLKIEKRGWKSDFISAEEIKRFSDWRGKNQFMDRPQ